MRLLGLALMAAVVAAPIAMAVSTPADAARHCRCLRIGGGGQCIKYGDCREVIASVGTFKAMRRANECRRSQAIVCEYDGCQVVCDTKK
jgi:hypothetical protein